MAVQIELTDAEANRLQRILSLPELERQKFVAYPFWIIAGLIFVVSPFELFFNPLLCIALLPMSFAAAMIGTARYGYYKFFRMLHYQNMVIEQLQSKPLTPQ